MQMANLINFKVGGTIHIVVNNQIGFTTCPNKSRSGVYCTDLAKSIDAPVFHVNADCVDEVAKVFRIAAEYRQTYKHDVVVDLVGYRKSGHNELDQPMFTQPLMYKKIS
jgi:2-oxoglutarate dehydrogenase E1 component